MDEKSKICSKCKKELSEEEKKIGLPLCQNCIGKLTDFISDKFKKLDEKNIEHEIDNFTTFILSSGKLFRLDDITILQCCFNVFMRKVVEFGKKDYQGLLISQKIFTDAIKFMEKDLKKINGEIKESSDRRKSSTNLVSTIDELIQKGIENNDISALENIEKCINEGMGKGQKLEKGQKREDDIDGIGDIDSYKKDS